MLCKLTNFIWSVDMTNKSKQKMKRMNYQIKLRVRKQTIEKKMKIFYQLLEEFTTPTYLSSFSQEETGGGKSYDHAIRYRTNHKKE